MKKESEAQPEKSLPDEFAKTKSGTAPTKVKRKNFSFMERLNVER